ncbi:MAG: PspC domain-containing protein, partial [Streptomyces sp.]|uniref:PspC domain-containing protein n=1 Tax=Streptomyces sp. TaxID=1931 RepID=UPI003D6A1D69
QGAPEAAPPARRLTRSRQPKVVGGVCAGLGRYFDLDPVVFRVPLVVLSVIGGLGLVFYGFAWLLIPAEGEQQNEARRLLSGRVEGTSLSAILTALVGCGLFLASIGHRSTPFSLLLAGAVTGAAYWSHHRRRAVAAEAVGVPVDPTTAHAVADAPPETKAPPVPAMPPWWWEPLTKDGDAARDTGYLWGPEDAVVPDGRGSGLAAAAGSRWGHGGVHDGIHGGVHGLRHRRERGRGLAGLTSTLALVAAGIGTFSGWETRPLGTSLTVGLACAIAVHGIGIAVSAFVGRIGAGSIVLVVLTALMMAGTAVIPKDIGTDWRDVTWRPSAASDVQPRYRLDGGTGELDLRRVRFTEDRSVVRTRARVGAGALKVVVPWDTRVELDAEVGAGEIRMPRGTSPRGDVLVDSVAGVGRHARETLPPFDADKSRMTLRLWADVTLGQLEIVRMLPSGERSDRVPETITRHEGEAGR